MRMAVLTLPVTLFSLAAYGAEPELAMRPMPQMGKAMINDQGEVEVTSVTAKPIWQMRPTPMCKYVSDVRRITRGPADFWVFKDGELVEGAKRAELLKKPTPVIFTALGIRGDRLDPFYRQFLKPGVVVVCLFDPPPEEEIPQPGRPRR